MEFEKASEKNAWNAVAQATLAMRQDDVPHPALAAWLRQQGVDIQRSVFPCVGLFDDDVFSGTLITQSRRVVEYFIDLAAPDSSEFEDVTEGLGPKDPNHPESDVRDLITMALVYFDHQRGAAA
ncbi:hypothetical protein [Alcanivorax quisquiliarum]|uniref:Uncharacterized protein n=1 Tax=Alcanivorax quisquiliarum TaxID=2933565 RepID=A0ABT0E609_9GAMM|nr:hypothetical protein [Alcanivorax quisquiliarum]MCK0537261.1 hypothetical protein [Alcanivorax quisquiliarum]